MWGIVIGTLCSGALASLSAKTLYQTQSVGWCGSETVFAKPYFLTMAMFIGEACCLAGYYLFVRPKLQREAVQPQPASHAAAAASSASSSQLSAPLLDDDNTPLPVSSSSSPTSPLPPCPTWFFLILCSFDLTASTLNFIGLLWVSASINQMFRGSMAVFVALFSVCVLRRRLLQEQWVAIGIVVLGLFSVGFSSYLQPSHAQSGLPSTSLVFLGILLIVLSAALNSFQNVVEELLMKKLVNYSMPHPLEIVGWEGVYGTLLSGLVMLPAVHYIPGGDCGGRQENSIDTLYQLRNPAVLFLVLAYIAGLGTMNYTSMELSRLLSAVVRNLVSAMRTVLVWLVSVLLFYAVGQQYGERLGLWSIVELCGFVLLIGGSILYSRGRERTAKDKVKHSSSGKAEKEEEEGEVDEDDVAINGVHNQAPTFPV